MSENILKALMQLFAIIAKVEDEEEERNERESNDLLGREVVEMFLNQELSTELVEEYLGLFDEFLEAHQGKSKKKDGKKKRTSVNSVKVLRICTQINEELAQKQKIIVLVRLLEFININDKVSEQEIEFVETVADTFNIERDEYNRIREYVEISDNKYIDSPYILYVNSKENSEFEHAKHIYSEGITGELRILRVTSVNIYFLRYTGGGEINLNGQMIINNRHNILTQGSSIRSSKVQPIYYSDIIGKFLSDKNKSKIVFKVDNVMYHFKSGAVGLHQLNMVEESGKMNGIMGGSGAGKSTLLNVLNGNYKPTQGKITINGIDVHSNNDDIEGLIGYVSQDDLLIEELTVFQNLFFNAKLCFGNLNDKQITKKVLTTLSQLGLYETKNLKVGSPMEKTISGGQRKRLNIALELIREPAVLFVDEPTSGLSSRDSENIMDLLKELALKGKLIFVVIHQPSSDIFKMFDKLLILDQGGYPIYNGNPVDAVIYFKTLVNHVNSNESECPTCGNVNPEQIFNIIESKVVDEYGNLTDKRKTKPVEWNKQYLKKLEESNENVKDVHEIPENTFKIPNVLKQFKVFFIRDILSKLTNQQYMIINMFEAPALAAILAFFVKFFNYEKTEEGYIFRNSENLPQFLFISVVVALFIGLTVAAEEIIKDQKILKRESFLNLSRGSYLFSKISIMFLISSVQSLFFVLVGNSILGISDMWLEYWAVMFSVSCFANILGLNISASFNAAKVIYILIPILIIPQLLFSGVIVKFDKLNPLFASEDRVPLIGNVMASRWAYEAMAVVQFKNNRFTKQFYDIEKAMSFSEWKGSYWIPELTTKLNFVSDNLENKERQEEVKSDLLTLKNEIEKEERFIDNLDCNCTDNLTVDKFDEKTGDKVAKYLDILKRHYRKIYDENSKLKDQKVKNILEDKGKEYFKELMNNNTNESLENFVMNKTELSKIVEKDNKLIQKKDPIYLDPYDVGFFNAHFYAPRKKLFGMYISTFSANLLVIWGMTLFLVITLYFDVLKFFIDGIGKLFAYIFKRNKSEY